MGNFKFSALCTVLWDAKGPINQVIDMDGNKMLAIIRLPHACDRGSIPCIDEQLQSTANQEQAPRPKPHTPLQINSLGLTSQPPCHAQPQSHQIPRTSRTMCRAAATLYVASLYLHASDPGLNFCMPIYRPRSSVKLMALYRKVVVHRLHHVFRLCCVQDDLVVCVVVVLNQLASLKPLLFIPASLLLLCLLSANLCSPCACAVMG